MQIQAIFEERQHIARFVVAAERSTRQQYEFPSSRKRLSRSPIYAREEAYPPLGQVTFQRVCIAG